MQLKKTELVLIGLTIAFVFFILGYFSGQNGAKGTFSVKTGLDSGPAEAFVTAAQVSPSPAAVSASPPASGKTEETDGFSAPETQSVPTAVPAPASAAAASSAPAAASSAGPVNINTAGAESLIGLPGIGEVLAGRIIEYRQQHGAFQKPEDVMEVKGIGKATYAKIKDLITVG